LASGKIGLLKIHLPDKGAVKEELKGPMRGGEG